MNGHQTDHAQVLNQANNSNNIFIRFSLSQRIEHILLLISFTALGITGLIQKFLGSSFSQGFILFLGGIDQTRQIHHVAAIALGSVSAYHIIAVLYKVIVLKVSLSMMPTIDDLKHLLHDIGFYFGINQTRAYYGRFNYAEKVEYFAVVWGTLIMGITGFMMWNPIATTRLVSGQYIPAAKAAHGGEAVLAVLAIILWHFYHVHLRQLNKSMITGKTTREEMESEHPAELAAMDFAQENDEIPVKYIINKRKKIFLPFATILSLFFIFSLYKFVTYEDTAIATIPRGETAEIYVAVTPTPSLVPTLAPTSRQDNIASNKISWSGNIEALFRNRCKNCHGNTSVGGLSLLTYKEALRGGKSGAAIVPNSADKSLLIQVQKKGNHPGQLTTDEIKLIIEWVNSGAPEN